MTDLYDTRPTPDPLDGRRDCRASPVRVGYTVRGFSSVKNVPRLLDFKISIKIFVLCFVMIMQ